jgi:hypothetical protein
MATSRHFSRYTGGQIPGADQYGNLHIGNENTEYNFGEIKWWNGPDEELGYIIAHEDAAGNHIGADETQAFIGFWRSELNDVSFIELANTVADGAATFTTANDAKNWLIGNGYWTSYGEGNITFVTGIQTYSVLCRMPGDTSNWGLINLNYESNTASVRPLGLSRSDWSRQDFYPTNESGYMLVFDNNDTGAHKILFLDAAGNTIQTVDISGAVNYDVYQGKIMAVRYNGGVWYFDGLNVYQYTHPTEDLNYTEVMWDDDATSSNGTFMYKIAFNDGSTLIEMLHSGTALAIAEYNNLIEDYEVKLYDQANYYVIFKKIPSGVYQEFKIRTISDNNLLHSVDLTVFDKEDESPMEYRHISFDNYSTNKFAMVIHNWDDSDVDYRIYTYNGTTNVLNSDSHVRGTDYPNFNMISYTNDRTRTTGTDSVLISFSSNSSWNGVTNTYAYFDIVYQMAWQTSLTTYVFTDAGFGNEIGINFNEDGLTNNYYAICTTNTIETLVDVTGNTGLTSTENSLVIAGINVTASLPTTTYVKLDDGSFTQILTSTFADGDTTITFSGTLDSIDATEPKAYTPAMLQVLSITEADGLEIITLGLLEDFNSPNIDSFGNKSCLRSYAASDGSGMILKYFGNTGGVIDELTVTGTATYNVGTYIGWNIFGVKYDGVLYQINTTTDEIVTIGPWSGNHDHTSGQYYEASTSERQGDLVHILYNEFTSDVIILKPTTYVSGTLASSSDYDIEVGKDSFMYIFEDPNSGFMQINLYDFNLTLLRSIVTDKTNYNFSEGAIKDRFYARHNDDNGTYTWYMITPTFDDSIMTSTSNTSRLGNDWVDWD